MPSVDTTFQSSTYANSLLLTAGGGYMLHTRGFSAEPYLNLQYLYTRIDAFTETASSTDNTGFATSVASQGVTSLQGILGLKLQYVWQPKFAVILPYVYGEYRHEFRNPSQDVSSEFGPPRPATISNCPPMRSMRVFIRWERDCRPSCRTARSFTSST